MKNALRYLISLFMVIILTCEFSFAQTPLNTTSIDIELLNEHMLKEVNKLRKKEKAPLLQNETALSLAAEDHVGYMAQKQQLTHLQKNKAKKTPKNRVDFYGHLFDQVAENIQLKNLNLNSSPKDKLHMRIETYESLAEQLVLAWKKSIPHYANMINPGFSNTYTAVSITADGRVYACQLFSGSKYRDTYKNLHDSVEFKPSNQKKCWRCALRPPDGLLRIDPDGGIYYEYKHPTFFFGLLSKPQFGHSNMRFFKSRKDGLAADIILLSQYPCDSNSWFNGLDNLRGIPLKPVYKKDFNGGIRFKYTRIYLGHVPDYIKEPYEVNLAVIQNNRPCSNTIFHVIPAGFHVEIPLSHGFDPKNKTWKKAVVDTFETRLFFDKSKIVPRDTNLNEVLSQIKAQVSVPLKMEIRGFASIEGSTESNVLLYNQRAQYLRKSLEFLGLDSAKIKMQTAENFEDFRKDVAGTNFGFLANESDSMLKNEIQNPILSQELEFFLKNHRYVNLKIIHRLENEMQYDATTLNSHLREAIENDKRDLAYQLQQAQYALFLEGKMSFEEIDSVQIPFLKKNKKLLHNQAIMQCILKPMTTEGLREFKTKLEALKTFKKDDKDINTSIAIVDYHLYENEIYAYDRKTFYDSISKRRYLDEQQRARILLNTATNEDWSTWKRTRSLNERLYYYGKAKRYISKARLDVDKTFEIASYYAFFQNFRFAYELVKTKIDETESSENLIFFLKLIHILEEQIPRASYLKFFKKIKEYSGDKFCSFFNSPRLNFQLLDDEEIKAIYCSACANNE